MKDINRAIAEILSTQEKIDHCNLLAKQVKKKRQLYNPKPNKLILLNTPRLVNKRKTIGTQEKLHKALTSRTKIEEDLLIHKFIITHKQSLRNQYVTFIKSDRKKC